MGKLLSKERVLKYGDNVVKGITSLSHSGDANVIETNDFLTDLITQARTGRITLNVSVSFQVDPDDADGQNAIRADFYDSEKSEAADYESWAIERETPVAGDITFSGACVITNYSEEGADDGDGLITGSFELRLTSFTESTQT